MAPSAAPSTKTCARSRTSRPRSSGTAQRLSKTLPEGRFTDVPGPRRVLRRPLEDMERTLKKYGAVLGHMVDASPATEPSGRRQPNRCGSSIRGAAPRQADRFHGANKWMIVPQSVRFATAHHIQAEIQYRRPYPSPHYRHGRSRRAKKKGTSPPARHVEK